MSTHAMGFGLAAVAGILAGCQGSAPPASEATGEPAVVQTPRYAEAFDSARRTLRDTGFILERVDAQAGVITTRPKTTAGLLTPWDREQTTFEKEVEDFFQRHQRVVRVEFEPPEGRQLSPDAPAIMHVHVTVQRVQIPGHKLETEAVWQQSYYVDTNLVERQMQPTYAVAWKQDERLAARLAAEIAKPAPSPVNWKVGEPVRPAAEPSQPPQPPPPEQPAPQPAL